MHRRFKVFSKLKKVVSGQDTRDAVVFYGNTFEECFNFLASQECDVASLHNGGDDFYYIEESAQAKNQNNSTYSLVSSEIFKQARDAWIQETLIRKAFHPGNFLSIAFILTAVGFGLVGFGIACPPLLVVTAIFFGVISAVTAVGYGIQWLRRDYAKYKGTYRAEHPEKSDKDIDSDCRKNYLKGGLSRAKTWMSHHKLQAALMTIGLVMLLGVLIVVAGHFIALAAVGTGFAFMTIGTAGGVIGLTSTFFAAGGLPPIISSILAAVTLVFGGPNIVDTFRRFGEGMYLRNKQAKEKKLFDEVKEIDTQLKLGTSNPELEKKAVRLYQEGAKLEYATMQFNLGICYAEGKGVSQDLTEAVKWYKKAAKQEHVAAQFQLATLYNKGEGGVSQDLEKAAKWYGKAAENGDVDAQFTLAMWYEQGYGVSQDLEKAAKWYGKAAENGDNEASQRLSDINVELEALRKLQVMNSPKSPLSSSDSEPQTNFKLVNRPEKPEHLVGKKFF